MTPLEERYKKLNLEQKRVVDTILLPTDKGLPCGWFFVILFLARTTSREGGFPSWKSI